MSGLWAAGQWPLTAPWRPLPGALTSQTAHAFESITRSPIPRCRGRCWEAVHPKPQLGHYLSATRLAVRVVVGSFPVACSKHTTVRCLLNRRAGTKTADCVSRRCARGSFRSVGVDRRQRLLARVGSAVMFAARQSFLGDSRIGRGQETRGSGGCRHLAELGREPGSPRQPRRLAGHWVI